MKVLLTGAFGNVGRSTIPYLLKAGHKVRCFDIIDSPHFPANRKVAARFGDKIDIFWGDLTKREDIANALKGMDAVVHLGAIISPLADKNPRLGTEVNVGGTANIVHSINKMEKKPDLIYTSSVAVYGDSRAETPRILKVDDPLPTPMDEYTRQKIAAEELVKSSALNWLILRLSFVFSTEHMGLDPLLFHVPLDTLMEPIFTLDAGLAVANAVANRDLRREVLNIAGGEKCRLSYREFIKRMMNAFGIGMLPDEAFSKGHFHLGYMDTEKSQRLLKYQNYSFDDILSAAKKKKRFEAMLARLFRPLARKYLLSRSEFYQKNLG